MLKMILILLGIFSAMLLLYLVAGEKLNKIRPAFKRKKIDPPSETASGKSQRDYNIYEMNLKEKLLAILQGATVLFVIGFIFYRSIPLSALVTPLALLYPNIKRKQLIQRQKKQLGLEFKEALYAISSSLSAGKSVEGAIRDAYGDLLLQYGEGEHFVIKELELILRKLEMNVTVETALAELAQHSHIEDIQSFSDVFSICHRSGGNLVEVMKNTSKIMGEKMEFKQELDLLLAQRVFEQKLLISVPFFMVIMLSYTAYDYMAPLFTTGVGRVVMTAALGLIGISLYFSQKIMKIEV